MLGRGRKIAPLLGGAALFQLLPKGDPVGLSSNGFLNRSVGRVAGLGG
jgi:hypothetical protein